MLLEDRLHYKLVVYKSNMPEELQTISEYAKLVGSLGMWPTILLLAFLFRKRAGESWGGLNRLLFGKMNERDSQQLKGLSNDLTHEVTELKEEFREFRKEVRDKQGEHSVDIARLLTKVFNGGYRR